MAGTEPRKTAGISGLENTYSRLCVAAQKAVPAPNGRRPARPSKSLLEKQVWSSAQLRHTTIAKCKHGQAPVSLSRSLHHRTLAVTFRFLDLVKIERQVFGDLIRDSDFRGRPSAARGSYI